MNVFEQIALIAQNEQKVYDAGYEKGKAEGGGNAPSAVLGELTITENGEYTSGKRLPQPGDIFHIKEDLSNIDFNKYRNLPFGTDEMFAQMRLFYLNYDYQTALGIQFAEDGAMEDTLILAGNYDMFMYSIAQNKWVSSSSGEVVPDSKLITLLPPSESDYNISISDFSELFVEDPAVPRNTDLYVRKELDQAAIAKYEEGNSGNGFTQTVAEKNMGQRISCRYTYDGSKLMGVDYNAWSTVMSTWLYAYTYWFEDPSPAYGGYVTANFQGPGWYVESTQNGVLHYEKCDTPIEPSTFNLSLDSLGNDWSFYGNFSMNWLGLIFNVPIVDGYNKVNVNVEPELKELIVTQNGTYKSREKIELGVTYSFKASYTNDELKEIRENSNGLFETEVDNAYIMSINGDEEWFFMAYEAWDQTFAYLYVPEEVLLNNPTYFPASGWFNAYNLANIEPPTVTFSRDTWFGMNLSALAELVFGLNTGDGFDTVIVDINEGVSFGEIIITQNGIYTPRGDVSPKVGGVYQLKTDFTGVDFTPFSQVEPGSHGFYLMDDIYYDYFTADDGSDGDMLMLGNYSFCWVSKPGSNISVGRFRVSIPYAGWWYINGNNSCVPLPCAPSRKISESDKNYYIPMDNILALFENGVPAGEYAFKEVPTMPRLLEGSGCYGEWHIPDVLGPNGYPVEGRIQLWIEGQEIRGVYFYVNQIYPEVMYVYSSIPYYGLNEPGWYARDNGADSYSPCDVPTEKFPVPIMEGCYGDMSQTMLYNFFEVPEIDGFDRVEVNVPVGTDTSDATATEDTILDGFSAYVNGEKVVGTKTFNLQEKTVKTKQSTVVPDEGYDGLSKVDISIEGELKITDNGTQDVTNYASVSVEVEKGVFPEGELVIKENGTHDVTSYASVDVSVSGGGGSDKAASIVDGSVTEITAEDLAGATRIRPYAFYHWSELKGIEIPDSVTEIGDQAFFECRGLTEIVIPGSVTSIGQQAFCYCTELTSAILDNGVTTIGFLAFQNCTKLTSIVLPDSMLVIGKSAFSGATGLVSVVIGKNVTTIASSAFNYCLKLKRIDCSSHTTVPTLSSTDPFKDTHSTLQIKVPANLIDTWKSAENWSNYADKIVTEFTNEV